nr:hypothetical protein GCM10020093_034330 [Planobispora longispora]
MAEVVVGPAALDERPLPDGVVRVLQGGLGHRLPAVGGPDLLQQHPERPAVAHGVVHRQQPHVPLRSEPQQLAAHQRTGGEVEPRPRVGGCARGDEGVRRDTARIGDRGRHREGLGDHLVRPAADRAQRRPQGLVAVDRALDGRREGRRVQAAGQLHGQVHVVQGRSAAREVLRQPEAFLGVGRRDRHDGRHPATSPPRRSPGSKASGATR